MVTVPNSIEGRSLNYLFQDSGFESIDFLKIDIEGAEFNLFNSEESLKILEFVKILSIEIHPEFGSPNVIWDILKNAGFLLFIVSETVIGIKINLISSSFVK
jgi:hypothetical protein